MINQHGSRTSLARDCNQLIADAAHMNPDWEAILTPVLAHLYPDRRLV